MLAHPTYHIQKSANFVPSSFIFRATNIHKFYKNVLELISSDNLYGSLNDFVRFGKNVF